MVIGYSRYMVCLYTITVQCTLVIYSSVQYSKKGYSWYKAVYSVILFIIVIVLTVLKMDVLCFTKALLNCSRIFFLVL